MKWLPLVFLSLITTYSFSQSKAVSADIIDAVAKGINASPVDSLSHLLTKSYSTDLEKVRSIFYWITDNISYNTIRYRPAAYIDDGVESANDNDSILKCLDERVAEIILKRRYALCDGYARLFKALCNYAGIKSEIIIGYARTGFGGRQFSCNHKWNAVMIDSNWYLLDATWASGYLDFSGRTFIKNYNESYFLSSPKYFVQDHYPDDVKWTLLNEAPVISEFNRSPFKQPSFNYKIKSYLPQKGVINATVGDTIKIALNTIDDKKQLSLLDINSTDSLAVNYADSCAKANKSFTINGDEVTTDYIVTNETAQWLQVIYNGNIVLRYKLNIKKEPYPVVHVRDIVIN